jgi:hypothetical protein
MQNAELVLHSAFKVLHEPRGSAFTAIAAGFALFAADLAATAGLGHEHLLSA